MTNIYEEISYKDFTFCEEELTFLYPCPCGDNFTIYISEILEGSDIAECPSCSLQVRMLMDEEDKIAFKQLCDKYLCYNTNLIVRLNFILCIGLFVSLVLYFQ